MRSFSTVPVLCLATVLGLAAPSFAHFQQIIPSTDVLPVGGPVTVNLSFTHPFDGGPVMEMKKPVRLGVVAGGRETDLIGQIAEKPVGGQNSWTVTHNLAEPGAAIFFVEPQPYWEPAENKYIVHYSKVIVDSYASGDGWDALVGLPLEIQPLTRPTGLWTGNLFSGVVLKNGAPVPFAEVEVEFINDGSIAAPNDAFITQVLKADVNGSFSYAMPRAGWWGFAALTEADTKRASPDGSQVSVEEGALIWIKATDMVAK